MDKLRIMLVEDERVVALMLRAMLRQLGHEVWAAAATGEDALQAIAAARQQGQTLPDMLLLDVTLAGELDGVDTALRLRELCATPFIFLTAYTDPATQARMAQAEPTAMLAKPVDLGLLAETLEQFAQLRETPAVPDR